MLGKHIIQLTKENEEKKTVRVLVQGKIFNLTPCASINENSMLLVAFKQFLLPECERCQDELVDKTRLPCSNCGEPKKKNCSKHDTYVMPKKENKMAVKKATKKTAPKKTVKKVKKAIKK